MGVIKKMGDKIVDQETVRRTLVEFKGTLERGELIDTITDEEKRSIIDRFITNINKIPNFVSFTYFPEITSLLTELQDTETKYIYTPTKIASLITNINTIIGKINDVTRPLDAVPISRKSAGPVGGKKRRSKRHKKRNKKRNRKTFKRK